MTGTYYVVVIDCGGKRQYVGELGHRASDFRNAYTDSRRESAEQVAAVYKEANPTSRVSVWEITESQREVAVIPNPLHEFWEVRGPGWRGGYETVGEAQIAANRYGGTVRHYREVRD